MAVIRIVDCMKTNTHGGKRKGSGRKPIDKINRKKTFSIMLSSENIEWIKVEVNRTNSSRSRVVNDAITVARS